MRNRSKVEIGARQCMDRLARERPDGDVSHRIEGDTEVRDAGGAEPEELRVCRPSLQREEIPFVQKSEFSVALGIDATADHEAPLHQKLEEIFGKDCDLGHRTCGWSASCDMRHSQSEHRVAD